MIVFFIVGMPGSGKTTLGRVLHSAIGRAFVEPLRACDVPACTFVEMSSVVECWLASTRKLDTIAPRMDEAIYKTPVGSTDLYNELWSRFGRGFNVCSGVRERHLLEGLAKTFIVGMTVEFSVRRQRYITRELAKGCRESEARALFDRAEGRAEELGVPELLNDRDVVRFTTDSGDLGTCVGRILQEYVVERGVK